MSMVSLWYRQFNMISSASLKDIPSSGVVEVTLNFLICVANSVFNFLSCKWKLY